jgi:hypothetical protein
MEIVALHKKGLLTDSQFERAKDVVLGIATPNPPSSSNPKSKMPATSSPTIPEMAGLLNPATPGQRKITAAEFGAALTKVRTPIVSTKRKTVRARERRYEKKTEVAARQLVGDGEPAGDEVLAALLASKSGRRLFPSTAQSIRGDEHLKKLAENVGFFVKSLGKHASRIGIRFLSKGLPTWFLRDEVGMTDKALEKRRVDQKVVEDPHNHSLCQQDYAADVSRTKVTDVEQTMLVDFYKKTTAVFSGTERRCVEVAQHVWEGQVTHTSRDHNQPSSQSTLARWAGQVTHMTEPQTIS